MSSDGTARIRVAMAFFTNARSEVADALAARADARDALRDMHCDQAQGYLISRPLPLDRFEAWLASRTVTIYDPASSVHVLRMMS